MHPSFASRPLLPQFYICMPTISCIWFPWRAPSYSNLLHQHITKKPISRLQSFIPLKYSPSLALPPLWSIQLFDFGRDAPIRHAFSPMPFGISPHRELWVGFQPVVVVQKERSKQMVTFVIQPPAHNSHLFKWKTASISTPSPLNSPTFWGCRFPFFVHEYSTVWEFLKNEGCMPSPFCVDCY